jgi:glycosyltransferase involved in cell wall biosynthesis
MVSYGLPVPGQKRGGIERAAHTLAQGLQERGHDVVVFSHDPRPDGAGYDVEELPWKRFVSTWAGRRATMGYLGNVLAILPDYRDFDALVMHGDSLLAPLTGRPVLRVMHGSALGEARTATSIGRGVLQLGVYVQELLTAACQAGVVAVSESARRENPFARLVVPHGVDCATFRPDARERSPEPSVLFVGTLDGRKRGARLLDGFIRHVRREHRTATLTIVGATGPSVPGVQYLQGVDDGILASLYRRAWVYASPSTYEGFGLPYLEAMASGTPVVASPNPGSREVLSDGRFGLLASDEDFAATLTALLHDSGRRAALSAAGLARARDLSLERMLDGYEALLQRLVTIDARSIASS